MKVRYTIAGMALALGLIIPALVLAVHLDLISINSRVKAGWYFIYPPRSDLINGPFSEWHRGSISVVMHSERECEQKWRQQLLKLTEDIPDPAQRARVQNAFRAGLCVENTDPRFEAAKPIRR
jgi:hypothetical protein